MCRGGEDGRGEATARQEPDQTRRDQRPSSCPNRVLSAPLSPARRHSELSPCLFRRRCGETEQAPSRKKRATGALVVGNNEEAVPGGETRKNLAWFLLVAQVDRVRVSAAASLLSCYMSTQTRSLTSCISLSEGGGGGSLNPPPRCCAYVCVSKCATVRRHVHFNGVPDEEGKFLALGCLPNYAAP